MAANRNIFVLNKYVAKNFLGDATVKNVTTMKLIFCIKKC